MATEFVDQLPPSSGKWDSERRRQIELFAAELRDHRGQWAVYPFTQTYQGVRAAASRIRLGKLRAFPSGFEAAIREKVLYVRYVGD